MGLSSASGAGGGHVSQSPRGDLIASLTAPRDLAGGDPNTRFGLEEPVARASQLLALLRRRHEVMPDIVCGDPTWEILLDLFVRRAAGHAVSVTSACIGSGAPSTTAKRHLCGLEDLGYVGRRSHPGDRRSTVVYLTDKGASAVRALLAR